jgi:hypothetical protein
MSGHPDTPANARTPLCVFCNIIPPSHPGRRAVSCLAFCARGGRTMKAAQSLFAASPRPDDTIRFFIELVISIQYSRSADHKRPPRSATGARAGLESTHRGRGPNARRDNISQNAVRPGCRRIRIGTRLSCKATAKARIFARFANHLRMTNKVRQGVVTGSNDGEECHALQGRDECDDGRCGVGHRECGCLRA